MLDLRPFTGAVVAAPRAAQVVAPPYDTLSPEARAALAASDPDSYLGALPPGSGTDDPATLDRTLRRCRDHLDRLRAGGRFRPLAGPTLAVLALGTGPHRATAIVGDVPVAAFADGRVRPHEQVDATRVGHLARYLEVVGVASSPVALAQRPTEAFTAATATVTAGTPTVAYRAEDGVDVALWCVTDPAVQERLAAAVGGGGVTYLVDGHHRAAAVARHASRTGAGPDDAAGRVLCAVLRSDQLTVHPFHRRLDPDPADVPVPVGRPRDAEIAVALDQLRRQGIAVTPLDGPAAPDAPHHVTITAAARWWQLDVSPLVRRDDLVASLDAQLVERDLVPRLVGDRSVRLTASAAPLGLGVLERPGAVGIALHPPDLEVVLAVADAGRTLPPKTTYVTPKLRSGLLVTPRPRPGASAAP